MQTSLVLKIHVHFPRLALLALTAPLLWACAPIASVEETNPSLPAAVTQAEVYSEIEKARLLAESATGQIKSNPKEAMAESETAAQLSLEAMSSATGPQADQALALYNYSVARLVESTQQSGEKPWMKGIVLTGPNGPINLTMTDLSKGSWVPQSDQLLATDRMEIGGTYFPDRVRIEGVGIPLVSKGPGRTEPWAPEKHYFGVTALARISGSNCSIEICDPGLTPSTDLAGKSRPLAVDFSAPLALGIKEEKPQKFGLLALLRTDRYLQAAKLIMVAPYRPNRQPIILIHGLGDSPITWTPMVNALNGNPAIRSKYQIWVFRYPSGLPFPMSASLLRQELAAVYQKYPHTRKAILIGHSMGGLLAHMQICDSGDDFCQDVLGKPLDQFKLDSDEAATIKGALYFKTSPYVAKTIFLATPHRGAEMASNPIGRIGAALVKLPVNLVTAGPKIIGQMNETDGEALLRRFPNSIDTLRPEARVVKALNELKLSSSIPYYSIIGDRGRDDGENSSDGVVPYASSHLDGAKSELIVPSDHTVQQNPQAITEVQRILLNP
jgi:hypothetical protein